MRLRHCREQGENHREPRIRLEIDHVVAMLADLVERPQAGRDKPRQAGIVGSPAFVEPPEAFRRSGDGLGADQKKPPSGNLHANGFAATAH